MGQRYDIPGRDNVEENRWGVAPSLTYKFNDQTRATLSYIYQHDDSVPDRGIPYVPATWAPPVSGARAAQPGTASCRPNSGLGRDRRARCNGACRSRLHERHQGHEHDALRQCRAAQPRTLPNHYSYALPGRHEPGHVPVQSRPSMDGGNQRTLCQQHRLFRQVHTGWLRHSLVAGVDIARRTATRSRDDLRPQLGGTDNFSDPDPYRFGGTSARLACRQISDATTCGAYLADQVKINDYSSCSAACATTTSTPSQGTTTILSAKTTCGAGGSAPSSIRPATAASMSCGARRSIRPPSS